ncbi:MAG: hypothetical protein CVV49_16875 [Spirochaetae bacterium HGW-Spirochaetae-5]|nr:MAG: hypothetical protein CVV49_16875 [Spirochaetae bacterium HGW-Spirochaetae-5]
MKRCYTVFIFGVVFLISACGGSSGGAGGSGGGTVNNYDVNLSSLTVSAGTLSPVFDQAVTVYAVELPSTADSITVTPIVSDSKSTVKVNNAAVSSGSASGTLSLVAGPNLINIAVTAEDGTTTKTYKITVNRVAVSVNANLAGLSISEGTLSPSFGADLISYAAEVPYSTSSIKITPTVAGVNAAVKVNNVTVNSGSESGSISLNVGANTITTVVTAESGAVKTYILTVSRVAASVNADLAGLTISPSAGALTPSFGVNAISYTAEVPYEIESITVTPTVAGFNAAVTVNTVSVNSGSASGSIGLNVGENIITTVVTAESGNIKTYTVTVTRRAALSTNANLSGLTLSSGTLSPTFGVDVISYAAEVSNATSSITVTPTVAGVNATVTVNTVTVSSGSASGAINLNVGANTITAVVTAESGAKKTYTVIVTRSAVSSSNADLAGLTLSTGMLLPSFGANVISYYVEVPRDTNSITVTPTVAGVNATVKVNNVAVNSGTASGSITLNVGANTITTVVTAESGAQKTYTIKLEVNATILPYLLSASSYYNSATSKYYIRVVYSEPMDLDTATTASNYTLTEDTSTACSDIAANPLSVSAISSTVYDLETSAQCGTGSATPTVYRVTVSSNVKDYKKIDSISLPNAATTTGTSATDQTKPRLIQALSLSPTTIRITFSEPMKTGDVTGSAECRSTYTTAATCTADIDAISGTQLKYSIKPSLGTIQSVETTADPSVFVITHSGNQAGVFYTVTAYAENAVANISEDRSSNDMAGSPQNRITFKGMGEGNSSFTVGSLFNDPFADGMLSSSVFKYAGRIYLGPDSLNAGAFRFEADASNPVAVTFWSVGSVCAAGTGTFGYGSAPVTPYVDLGPNGERGITGFNSGVVTIGSVDYEILMANPLKDAGTYTYFTQDIDTELDWKSASFSPATGYLNTKSVQLSYACGDSYYSGLSSAHGTQAPILIRQKLTDTNSDGVLELSGSYIDLAVRSLSGIGKNGSNPAADGAAVVGIDSMIYIPAGGTPTPVNSFYIANNGGVARSAMGATLSFTTFMLQSYMGGVTLVLPDSNAGLEKIRPGQKGIPAMVVYKGHLYMVRNLAVSQTAANETVNNGAELWKCTENCSANINWKRVARSSNFNYDGQSTNSSNNKAIGFLQVSGNALYMGFDNTADGITIWKATSEVISEADFIQQGNAGLGQGNSVSYIYSSTSLDRLGRYYIYLTVGNYLNAFKVIRQID